MMLYPAMGELNARIHNRYMLVNVVARRARQIAEAYEQANQKLDDKPVTIAINEVANGVLDDPEQMPPKPKAAPEPEASADADSASEAAAPSEDSESADPEAAAESEEPEAVAESEEPEAAPESEEPDAEPETAKA